MKKMLVVLALLLVAAVAFGQTVAHGIDITFAWDAVTTNRDGGPLGAGVLTYTFMVRSHPAGVSVNVAELPDTQLTYTWTVPDDGLEYDVGVRATLNDGGAYYYSVRVWSSVEGSPVPFVVIRALPESPYPAAPLNLHIQ